MSQPLGTTIKTDGTESDPYAILTVINMHEHHVRVADVQTYSRRVLTVLHLRSARPLDP